MDILEALSKHLPIELNHDPLAVQAFNTFTAKIKEIEQQRIAQVAAEATAKAACAGGISVQNRFAPLGKDDDGDRTMADAEAAEGAELQRVVSAALQAAMAKHGAPQGKEGAGEAQGTEMLQAIVPSEIIEAVTEQWSTFRRSHGKAARAAVAPYCS